MRFIVVAAFAAALSLVEIKAVSADALDLNREEFRSTWRKKVTGGKITFDKTKRSFSVEFSGTYMQFNTSDANYSHCTSGRDGGANLCVSGRMFDCAFLVTVSTGNEVHLELRRAGPMGDDFCRGMSGEYVVLRQ